MIAERDLQELLTKAPALSDFDARRLTQALQAEVLERCAMDGLFWLKFVQTRDEADGGAMKPVPMHLPYISQLWTILDTRQAVVIAKSRQMWVSWLVSAYCVWTARFKKNQAIYWQSQQYEDSVAMICMPEGGFDGRCQFIEENLPTWMRAQYKPSEGRIQYPDTGSIIQALAGGAGKIRSKVVSIYVGDEFAHQEDQKGTYTAVAPLIQKGAKAFFISTSNGSANQFATLYHGREVGTESYDALR